LNKFETSLLQALSSIDESLKAIAAAGKPAKLAPTKAQKPGNGALPKPAGKPAKTAKGKGGKQPLAS
jgi:hypothetical protein